MILARATSTAWHGVLVCLAVVTPIGCALKPPPERAQLQREALAAVRMPAAWTGSESDAAEVREGWLASFDDPRLSGLVAEALAYNADLRAAGARVEQAAGYVKVAGGQLLPAVDLMGRASVKDSSGVRGVFLSLSWELDVWGRLRYGVRAAEDQYASSRADFEYGRQSLAALVVKAYLLATEARLQRELAAQSVAAAQQLVELASDRQRIGAGNELDVVLARTNVQSLRDAARQMDLAYVQSLRALELLLGRYPAAEFEARPQLATLPGPVPAGLPSSLLERRPDVLAAERRVALAFHRTEEARAARLPSLSITTGLNHISSDLLVLKQRDNPVWSAAARLAAPLYRGGALEAQVEVRTAEQREAVAAYAQTGLNAFGEVENALASEFALLERQAILDQAVRDSERVLELEQTRYRVGARDLRSVTQQQLALYSVRMTLLRVQSEQRVQRVNLHLALGGSFDTSSAAPQAASPDPRALSAIADETVER
jgi:multidrug efflux system outer membrane protein